MDEYGVPEPAQVVVAVLHADEPALHTAIQSLSPVLGRVRMVGPQIPFQWTSYYRKEMGCDLTRCLLAGDRLAERDQIADLKLWTNRIEKRLIREDGTRRINLDPALLTAENFVLATTKNRGHRIYLGKRVFAEVTLVFVQGAFRPLEWTYPDYRTDEIRSALEQLRLRYMQRLRHEKHELIEEVPT